MEKGRSRFFWRDVVLSVLAVFAVALLLMIGATLAHAQQGPITTPQLNSDFYVGTVSGFYSTIQNTVTLRCAAPGLGSRVIIPAGSPADGAAGYTIAAVTGGCAQVPIIDLRVSPVFFYKWVTSAYVLQGTAPAGTAGGDLSGTYPNPTVSKVNGAAVPASSNVLASDASGKLITTTNVPLLNAANVFTAKNNFSSELDVASGASTGLFITPSQIFGENGLNIALSINPQTGAAVFGVNATGSFAITPTGVIAGGTGGVQQWSLSNINGLGTFKNLTDQALTSGKIPVAGTGGALGDGPALTSVALLNGPAAFTTLQATTKIVNGAGLQLVTAAGCAITAGAVGNQCGVVVPLPVTEPDTTYSAVCNFVVGASSTGPLSAPETFAMTTTSFTVALVALSSTAANVAGAGTVQCIVAHP